MRYLFTFTLLSLTVVLSALAEDKPKHDSFASCVSASLQGGSGGVAAEAAARKACREQFPMTNAEIEAKNQIRANNINPSSGAQVPKTTPTVSGSAGSSSQVAAPSAPVSVPTPVPTPPTPPSVSPGPPSGGGPPDHAKAHGKH